MKTVNFSLIVMMLLLVPLFSFGQKDDMSEKTLEIKGAALLNDKRTSDYSISVYLDGSRLDSLYSKSKKTLTFYVAYDKVYTFLFQKEHCEDKIVIVNTKLPNGLNSLEDDTFDFEVEMSQALSKNTEELKDYPVAVLLIDKKQEILQASAAYNKFTHAKPKVITTKIQK